MSSEGIKRVKELYHKDNFKFIVDGKEYSCSKYEAVFFSPKILDLFLIDSSLNEYEINTSYNEEYHKEIATKDKISKEKERQLKMISKITSSKKSRYSSQYHDEEFHPQFCDEYENDEKANSQKEPIKDYFLEVMKLMKGETIEIDKDLRAYLMEVNLKLGNVELASHLISETTTEININNAIERLQYKSISGVDFKSEIDFIASNFEAFSNESYQKLDQNLLEMILTSSSFRIESEDSFYEKIAFSKSRFIIR